MYFFSYVRPVAVSLIVHTSKTVNEPQLLQGCYMDLDVVSSRRRALAKKLTGFIDARYTTPEVLERLKEETQRKHVVEGPE